MLSTDQTPIMSGTARAFLFKNMENKYVVTLKKVSGEVLYEVELNTPDDIPNTNEGGLDVLRKILGFEYSKEKKEKSEANKTIEVFKRILNRETFMSASSGGNNDIEMRREIMVELLKNRYNGGALWGLTEYAEQIFNWIKEGRV